MSERKWSTWPAVVLVVVAIVTAIIAGMQIRNAEVKEDGIKQGEPK